MVFLKANVIKLCEYMQHTLNMKSSRLKAIQLCRYALMQHTCMATWTAAFMLHGRDLAYLRCQLLMSAICQQIHQVVLHYFPA